MPAVQAYDTGKWREASSAATTGQSLLEKYASADNGANAACTKKDPEKPQTSSVPGLNLRESVTKAL